MEQPIQTEWVKLRSGTATPTSATIDAYLAQPDLPPGSPPLPVIVVLQEIFGVNPHIRDVTDRIAREGYIAIAPALYHRQIPGFECGYDDDGFAEGRQYKNNTRAVELLQDIQAAMDYGRSLPQAQAGHCGCIGFCFGGHVAYLAATLPDVAATAVFYGAGITTFCPGESGVTLDRTAAIHGTLYGFFGTADPLIPLDHVDTMEQVLLAQGINHKIFRYPQADHGFFCDRRASFEPNAAADAWEHAKELFGGLGDR